MQQSPQKIYADPTESKNIEENSFYVEAEMKPYEIQVQGIFRLWRETKYSQT